jgi:transposase InsO family protein
MARACRRLQIRHIFTRPYHPQTNGKVERWIRTALRECLYLEVFNSPAERLLAIQRFVRYYNEYRPHLGLRGLSPRRFLDLRLAA